MLSDVVAADSNEMPRLRFHNPRTENLTLVLEPWGEVHRIRPGTTVDVVGEGPTGDGPEVTYDDNTITVWGWAGSVLHVVPEGTGLNTVREGRPAVPRADEPAV